MNHPLSVNIKIINRSSHPLPRYVTDGAAGMDLCAYLPETSVELAPMQRALIPTGLYMEIPQGYEAQIRPRSGLALRKGLTVINSPGTIDSDYRGEIGVALINLGSESVVIADGDRICQMVVAPVAKAILVNSSELDETLRGKGGFGSTGI